MVIKESIRQAFDSVRVNKLRAFLTLLSIAIGVFAIMGAGTLTSSLEKSVSNQLDKIGESTFWIQRMPHIMTGNTHWKYRKRKSITYSQVTDLKRRMTITQNVSAYTFSSPYTIKSESYTTNNDVYLVGADDRYFYNNATNISYGRSFNEDDINMKRKVAIIGNDVVVKIFPSEDPIGKEITIKNQRYTVIGILEIIGAILGQSKDNMVMIPITNFLQYYANEWEESLNISIKANNREQLSETIDESIGVLRGIRKDKPWEENSFELFTNETITDQFGGFLTFLSIVGWLTGGFALIAAGVGIMNIMLVSVKERTREIGIRKAIGARRSWILMQFIIETVTLCQLGCLIGIVMGGVGATLLGNLAGLEAVFPVYWIITSIIICTLLGVGFGAYPAWKAANLDPIEALRYE